MAWFRHDRSEKKRSHVFSMGAARPLAPEFREVPSPQPHVQIWSRDQAHLPPLYLYTLWCFLVKIRQNASLIHFHFILGPKLGSGLPNTCLFSWIFSVKFFVEYLRPHLKTQGKFPSSFDVFCGVLIPPFLLGNVVMNIPITNHLTTLIDRAFATWMSILPYIDHSKFLTILINQICEMLRSMCQLVATLSNVTSTTKCILQWQRLLFLQFDNLLVSKVWIVC